MVRIVKYSSASCMPCRMMSKVLEQLKAKHPSIEVVEHDIADGTHGYQISAVPTIIIQKDGVENVIVGVVPMSSIEVHL